MSGGTDEMGGGAPRSFTDQVRQRVAKIERDLAVVRAEAVTEAHHRRVDGIEAELAEIIELAKSQGVDL